MTPSPSLIELATQLGHALTAQNWRVTTAESCTAGLVSAAITAISGSSQWFECGFVTYSNQMKQLMLNVPADLLTQFGAVSGEVALAMAIGALTQSTADLALSITGIAGPDGGTSEKPVGTVYFAWVMNDGRQTIEKCLFSGDRQFVRSQAVLHALNGALAIIHSPMP